MALWETVHDLRGEAETLRRRPYGVIVMERGGLDEIRLRPWPTLVSTGGLWGSSGVAQRAAGDRCWLYFNQPCRHGRFLALKFIVTSRGASFATLRSALIVLDEIARIKRTDAIVAEIRNQRVSDRLLHRWGWEPHLPSSRRRHFIKRFYGQYPDPGHAWSLVRQRA
jgi:hypothetical protein